MADVLRIEQNHDLTTRYGQAFRERLVFGNFAADYTAHTLCERRNAQATRVDVDNALNSQPMAFVSAFGHGTFWSFTEQGGTTTMWDTTDSFSNMAGAIVHLTSCGAGAVLGRDMVLKGIGAYWGYTVDFTFTRFPTPPANLDSDTKAEPFFEMDAIIDRGVLDGHSAATIFNDVTAYVGSVWNQLSPNQQTQMIDNFVHLVSPATTWGDEQLTI